MTIRRTSPSLLRSSALVSALALTALAPDAAAHGGLPRAFSIITEPGKPDHTILRSDIWGLFRTVDGGKSWQWICAEAFDADSYTVGNRKVQIAPGGRIFVASSFDGLWTSDDACQWNAHSTFEGELVADVHVRGDQVHVLTSTGTGDGKIDGNVWLSMDNGATFAKVGAALPTDLAASNVAVAPSAPGTLYVSAAVIDAPDGSTDALMSSTDGGATWERHMLPISVPGATLRIQAVHPTEPGTVFLWVDLREGLNEDKHDELWVATEGGAEVKKLYAATGDLPGFALSPDGKTVFIAGPKEGVRKATLEAALADGPSAFAQTFDGQTWGLSFQGDTLYAGNNDYTARPLPRFTYGMSADQGTTFSEVMNICQAEFPTCDASSTIERRCREILTETGGFDQDYLSGPRCAPPAPDAPDAGTGGTPGGKKSSGDDGGCSSSPGGSARTLPAIAAAWAALTLGVGLGRRRRSRST